MRSVSEVALLVVLAASCGHARQTAPQQPAPEAQKPRPSDGGAPVAVSPAGLLVPGAELRLQRALIAQGVLPKGGDTGQLDGPTREALRKFQNRAALPATGLPDYETADRLGLKLDDVFHHREPSGAGEAPGPGATGARPSSSAGESAAGKGSDKPSP